MIKWHSQPDKSGLHQRHTASEDCWPAKHKLRKCNLIIGSSWMLMLHRHQSLGRSDVSWCFHPFNTVFSCPQATSTHPASQAKQPCQPRAWSLESSGPPWLFLPWGQNCTAIVLSLAVEPAQLNDHSASFHIVPTCPICRYVWFTCLYCVLWLVVNGPVETPCEYGSFLFPQLHH